MSIASLPEVCRVRGTLQTYDWGATDFLPDLLGFPADGRPYAELWLGAHPKGAASLLLDDGEVSLLSMLARSPASVLGSHVNAEFGGRLPFLLKFLAISAALSVQVHPTLEQARSGFDRETAAGVDIDDPRRVYVDAYDKPEQICAISPVTALCGFRALDDVAQRVAEIPGVSAVQASSPGQWFLNLLELAPAQANSVVSQLQTASAKHPEDLIWSWVQRLLAQRPGDVTAAAPLFLNLVELQPGQSLYLDAGTIHCYLLGFAAEVMGSSDNVIRAGLTAKHVDIPELKAVLNLAAGLPQVINPIVAGDGWTEWPTPCEYFQLRFADLSAGDRQLTGPAMICCTAGRVTIAGESSAQTLNQGEAAFVTGGNSVTVAGVGTVYACSVNSRMDAARVDQGQ